MYRSLSLYCVAKWFLGFAGKGKGFLGFRVCRIGKQFLSPKVFSAIDQKGIRSEPCRSKFLKGTFFCIILHFFIIFYHFLSFFIIFYHFLSFFIIFYHFLSFFYHFLHFFASKNRYLIFFDCDRFFFHKGNGINESYHTCLQKTDTPSTANEF